MGPSRYFKFFHSIGRKSRLLELLAAAGFPDEMKDAFPLWESLFMPRFYPDQLHQNFLDLCLGHLSFSTLPRSWRVLNLVFEMEISGTPREG